MPRSYKPGAKSRPIHAYTGSETDHAKNLFHVVCLNQLKHPELALFHHIPNEVKATSSEMQEIRELKTKLGDIALAYRHARRRGERLRQIADLKAQGMRPGVLDFELPTARGGFIGLWIELKVDKNTTSPEQKRFIADLKAAGHCVAVCRGWDKAWAVLEWYLQLPPTAVEKQALGGMPAEVA